MINFFNRINCAIIFLIVH